MNWPKGVRARLCEEATEANLTVTTDSSIVIPGHGTLSATRLLQAYYDMLVAIHENVSQPLIGRPGVQGCADRWQGVCLSRPARLARNRDIARLCRQPRFRPASGRTDCRSACRSWSWLEDPTPRVKLVTDSEWLSYRKPRRQFT